MSEEDASEDAEEDAVTDTEIRPVELAQPEKPAKPKSKKKKKGKKKSAAPALWYALGAAGLVIALLVALVVVLLVKRSDDSDTIAKYKRVDAARASVLVAARRYAIDFTTYDYRNLDAGFARTEAELTGTFKSQYTATAKALKATIQKYQAVATATLQQIGVTSVTKTDAVVMAFVDQTITNTTSTTPMVERDRIRMTLHRKGSGPWLISDLQLP